MSGATETVISYSHRRAIPVEVIPVEVIPEIKHSIEGPEIDQDRYASNRS